MDEINKRFDRVAVELCGDNNVYMSRLLGISEGSVRLYRSSREPRLLAIINLCKSLNVSADWMLFGKGEMLNKDTKSDVSATRDAEISKLRKDIENIKQGNDRLNEMVYRLQEQNFKLQDKIFGLPDK